MAVIPQPGLFSWKDIENPGDLERLRASGQKKQNIPLLTVMSVFAVAVVVVVAVSVVVAVTRNP